MKAISPGKQRYEDKRAAKQMERRMRESEFHQQAQFAQRMEAITNLVIGSVAAFLTGRAQFVVTPTENGGKTIKFENLAGDKGS